MLRGGGSCVTRHVAVRRSQSLSHSGSAVPSLVLASVLRLARRACDWKVARGPQDAYSLASNLASADTVSEALAKYGMGGCIQCGGSSCLRFELRGV